jgi:hypothetical protein
MLFQVVSIQLSDRWTLGEAELVDMAVERIGDAAHVASDAKGS